MAHRDRLADFPRRTGLSRSDEDEEELGRAVLAECADEPVTLQPDPTAAGTTSVWPRPIA
jgi:hypothetical protein